VNKRKAVYGMPLFFRQAYPTQVCCKAEEISLELST